MSIPKIDYSDPSFGANNIAYDLAMLYAKSKFDNMLQRGYDFDKGIVSAEIEELEYLSEQFLFALEFFSNRDPGAIELLCERFQNEGY